MFRVSILLLLVVASYALGNVKSVTVTQDKSLEKLFIEIKDDKSCTKGYTITSEHQIYIRVRTLAFAAKGAEKNLEILKDTHLTKDGYCKIQYITMN
jgi:uncharacterized protein YxeA